MDNCDFSKLIKNCTVRVISDSKYETTEFFQKKYSLEDPASSSSLHPVSGGEILLSSPLEASFSSLPFLFITYCIEGALFIEHAAGSTFIPAGHFFALPASEPFFLKSVMLPGCFRYFFISGDITSFLPYLKHTAPLHPALKLHSPYTLNHLLRFPLLLTPEQALDMHLILTPLLTSYAKSSLSQNTAPAPSETMIPGYLDAMRNIIHQHFNEPHTLQNFEDRFGISHYRLCREYRDTFGISPMLDLNNTRIEHAKKMLLETPLNIQEICNRTGFYDINNFIRIFKKNTGLTPGHFRKNSGQQITT